MTAREHTQRALTLLGEVQRALALLGTESRRATRPVQRGRLRRAQRALRRAVAALDAGRRERARRHLEAAAGLVAMVVQADPRWNLHLYLITERIGAALGALDLVAEWTWAERMAVNCDFLRTGRTPDQRARGKYADTMYFGVLPPAERRRLLDAHLGAGRTGYPLSVQDEPYRLTDLAEAFLLDPEQVGESCEQIIAAGLIPVPQLLSQAQVRDLTLDQLEDFMGPHAEMWGHLTGLLWLTFQQDQAVRPDSQREGMRGDDWVSALAGRAARLWGPDVPILLHQTAGEHHDHRSWAASGKAGEEPTQQAVLAFQFHSWNPAPDAIVEYRHKDGTIEHMSSRDAHDKDLHHMLTHPYPWLLWEYGQSIDDRVEWRDEDVWALGARMSDTLAAEGRPDGVGCGAS